jgi:hypothetical protein
MSPGAWKTAARMVGASKAAPSLARDAITIVFSPLKTGIDLGEWSQVRLVPPSA